MLLLIAILVLYVGWVDCLSFGFITSINTIKIIFILDIELLFFYLSIDVFWRG